MEYARKNQNSIFLHGTCMAYSQTVAELPFSILGYIWMGYSFSKSYFFQDFSDWIEYKGTRHTNYPSSSCLWRKHRTQLRYGLLRKRILAVLRRKFCFSKFYFSCQVSFCMRNGSWSTARNRSRDDPTELFITKLLSFGRDIKSVRTAL